MMDRREAEKLLGGYATGTLTDAERASLFEAALEHQELYDALADEEALRELLADPEARAHLLALLPAPAPPRPLWRRPAFLGLAASLFLLVTTQIVLKRAPLALDAPARRVPAPATSDALTGGPQAPEDPAARQAQARAKAKEAPSRRPEPPKEEQPQAPPAAQALPAPKPAPAGEASFQKSAEQGAALGAAAGNVTSAPVLAESPKADAQLARKLEARERDRGDEDGKRVREAKAAPLSPAAMADRAEPSADQDPTWSLEPLADGRLRIRVHHAPHRALYLVLRDARGARTAPRTAGGRTESRFDVALGPGLVIDLFELPEPVNDPASLPARGPLKGFRARIYPAP